MLWRTWIDRISTVMRKQKRLEAVWVNTDAMTRVYEYLRLSGIIAQASFTAFGTPLREKTNF